MMNHDDKLDERSEASVSEAERARIAAELAALGELPPDEDEFLQLDPRELGTTRPEDVQMIEALAEWADPVDDSEPLSALEARRVWRHVESRRASRDADGGSRAWIGLALAGLAAAAVVLVVVIPRASGEGASDGEGEMVAALSEQAHAGLSALGVDTAPGSDAARVRQLAVRYARRMDALDAQPDAAQEGTTPSPVERPEDAG